MTADWRPFAYLMASVYLAAGTGHLKGNSARRHQTNRRKLTEGGKGKKNLRNQLIFLLVQTCVPRPPSGALFTYPPVFDVSPPDATRCLPEHTRPDSGYTKKWGADECNQEIKIWSHPRLEPSDET